MESDMTLETMREQKARNDDLIKKWPKTDQEILEAIELVKKGLLVWSAWISLNIAEISRNIAEKEKEAERCKS